MQLAGMLPQEQVESLPYVRAVPRDGRVVFLLPYFERESGFMLPLVKGERLEVGSVTDLAEGLYLAQEAADAATDVPLPLVGSIIRRLSFPNLFEPYGKVEADLLNLAASLEKYFFLHDHARSGVGANSRTLVATEFEYLLVNARAFYEQLQFLFREFWTLVVQPGKQNLPRDFKALSTYSADDLKSRYKLPAAFVTFVLRASPGFLVIRNLRDQVAHHGRATRDFLALADGFAVPVERYPWNQFPFWADQPLRGDRGCYLAVVAWISRELLVVAELLEAAIMSETPLPAAVTDWQVFFRSPFVGHFGQLDDYLAKPWRNVATVGA